MCCCGSLHLIPVFSVFIQTLFTFDLPTPWLYCRICSLDLPVIRTTYRTSSVINGMCRAKAGVSAPRQSLRNSACWIVHSNQVCGVLSFCIKKRYHRRSRRNVVQTILYERNTNVSDVPGTTQLAKLSFNHSHGRAHS